jgi:hypothetical protein
VRMIYPRKWVGLAIVVPQLWAARNTQAAIILPAACFLQQAIRWPAACVRVCAPECLSVCQKG